MIADPLCHSLIVRSKQGAELPASVWADRIRNAVNDPLSVVKADGMKRTLQVDLDLLGRVCLQEFNWDFKRRVFSLGRMSRGERIWLYSCALKKLNLSIAEPLIFMEQRRFGFLTKTYIGSRWHDGVKTLGCLAMSEAVPRDEVFQRMLFEAAGMIARLHNGGYVHGDLKWSNFFCPNKKQSEPILIDLDGLSPSTSLVKQGRDFARFVFSAMEYDFADEDIEKIIDHYSSQRQGDAVLLDNSIRKYLKKKGQRYKSRRADL